LACPYFMPVTRLESGAWPHPSRLPLGCGWSGHCTAPGHENAIPSQETVESSCNLGYASGCSWAPAQRSWDAVRFAVLAPAKSLRDKASSASSEASHCLRLDYVCERDHRPVEHGELSFDLFQQEWTLRHSDSRIQKMAECYLDSYLKKKS
jgi:hypothetical protein